MIPNPKLDLHPVRSARRLAAGLRHASSGNAQRRTEDAAAGLWQTLLRPSGRDQVNQRNVLVDGIGVGLAAGVGTFLSVFLVRLGASPLLIGLLTSMPALTGMILSMPVGEFLARRRYIVPWFSRARLFVLSCYALTGLVPFLLHDHRPEAIIAIWAIATLPQTIVSVAFTVVMGAVAGVGGRYTLMSRRWSILGLSNALAVLLVGQVLPRFDFPINYQIVFIGSAAGGLISYIFSSSIRLDPVDAPPARLSLPAMLRLHGASLRANRRFVNFTIGQFIFRWGLALPVPLFPIYWVRSLGATDPQISAINSTQTAVLMVAYFLWARATQRRGSRWVLLATSLGVSFYPLLTALTPHVNLLILWAALAGLFQAGVDLVFFDALLATCPRDEQAAYIGIYQTTVFVATFLAPLLGTAIADLVGLGPALIVGTALRLAGFAAMWLLGVGGVDRKPPPEVAPGGAEPAGALTSAGE